MGGSAILTTFHLDGPTDNGLYHNIYYNRIWLELIHRLTGKSLPHFIVMSTESFVPSIFFELRYPVVIVQEGYNQLEHFNIGLGWLDSLGFDYVYVIEQDLAISKNAFQLAWTTDLFFGDCTVGTDPGFEKSFFCGPVATLKANMPSSISQDIHIELRSAFESLASPFEQNHWTYDLPGFEEILPDGGIPSLKHHYPAEYLFGYSDHAIPPKDPNRLLLYYLNAKLGPAPGPSPVP